ncbi:MAG: DUF6786 family protein [Armatimonadota bacterium]
MAELKKLVDTLGAVGKSTELFESADGSKVLMLPYGGRVLGLFAPDSEENFYWSNDAFVSVEKAKEFYAGNQWHNSGGDRTWLAPESDLFFPNFPELDVYFQQRSLDPGKYEVVKSGDGFKLVNKLTVNFSRHKEDVDLVITKSVGPAPNPLRYERGIDLKALSYAGYTQFTSLEIVGAKETKAHVGLWNLVQMPHGGDLIVPTYSKAEPNIYFGTVGTIGPEDMIINDHLFIYKMRQMGEHKLAIRAVVTTGRVGYIYQTGDKWALIVRNFWVNPSGEYVDTPWKETEYFGYSTQACNVNSGLGQFSELEYHIPAIGHGTGLTRCDDQAQVWAFRGSRESILQVARILLSPELK